MRKTRLTYIKNILLPCFLFSVLTGIFTGALIYLFKISASFVLGLSSDIYSYVRENPVYLPFLVLGAMLLGLSASFILSHTKNCRGGGIPTSVAILRGLIEFRWLKSIFFLFGSALLTFLGGVPLGNEGPSVQMGTAVGRGATRILGKNNPAWDRYIMTGGACAGFAVATGAPLSGILFAFEEAHRKFSPMLFMVAGMTVTAATATMNFLCEIGGVSSAMFDFATPSALPLRYLWIIAALGIVSGLLAVAFTKLYSKASSFVNITLKDLPFTVKILLIFALVAIAGFASSSLIGTGHDVIHTLTEGEGVWFLIILTFTLRALFLMLANNVGVSGGIFVPTLTFGALIGALISEAAVALGLMPEEYSLVLMTVGMVSFLSASSRTPLTALAFAIEALSGLTNILPIAIGVTISFLVIETWGVTSLHDMVINSKVAAFNRGKESVVVDTFITVKENSFAVGKEARDILWPPTCLVLSIKKPKDGEAKGEHGILGVGDTIHIHYQTFEPETTVRSIEAIVGIQETESPKTKIHTVDEHSHIVPEL